ncbi:MAG: hypothetical protein HDR45_01595 [Bacteroides sp.]|nr:hypothetical protein [Bacteroides sp.]
MKFNRLLSASLALGMAFCSLTACAKIRKATPTPIAAQAWNYPDSAVCEILGTRLCKLITNPKCVEMYSVAYRDSAHANSELISKDFVKDSLICKLNKEQVATLNFLLISDSANYSTDTLAIPMIPHHPLVAFDYINKQDHALVWYSPGDFTWGIRFDGKNQFKYNTINADNLNRFCKLLINNFK